MLFLDLGFSKQAASIMTSTCVHTINLYRYAPHFPLTGMVSRQQGGGGVSWTAPACPIIGGNKDQEKQLTGIWGALAPLPFVKIHPTEKTNTRIFREMEEHLWRARRGHRGYGGTRNMQTPHRLKVTWYQANGVKRGGCTVTVHGRRRRHASWGTETSGRGWWMASAGKV